MKKRIVISACLLGHPTRYDGKSKPADLSVFGDDVEFVAVCPELGAGFGVPRPPIELTEYADGAICVERVEDRENMTAPLADYCAKLVARFKAERVDAFVFKARSPSCGLATPVHDRAGNDIGKRAPGVWAAAVQAHFPDIPQYEI